MTFKITALLWIAKCLIYIYDFITLPVYFFIQRPWKQWKADKAIWAKHVQEDDPHSPCVRCERSDFNRLDGINTMDELFRMSVVRNGTKKCMAVRELISEADQYFKDGRVSRKVVLGDYKWFSYVEINERIENLMKSVLQLGLEPKKPILIFAETRIEWMLICLVCFRLNVPVVTLYATLGEEGILHGINETEVTHIFTSQDLLIKLKKIIYGIPHITHIIYMENAKPVDNTGFPGNITISTFSQLEESGATYDKSTKPNPPSSDDLALILYTSGSTGTPKGVKLTHKNLIATTVGIHDFIPDVKPEDVYIAYLPLAHVFEISAENFCFVMGIPIGYSSPNTLTDESAGIMPSCRGDAILLKPSLMIAVPLILNKIRKGVNEVVKKKGAFSREFFQFAMNYKLFWYKKGFRTPILTRLVLKKVKEMVGGNLRAIVSAGAPLSPHTQDFIRTCLDLELAQAYGMTETAASATVMAINDHSTGRSGAPLSNCYLKLVDWSEGNYRVSDSPHPRGEIVIGGDCVSPGYLKNDELTRESFTEENDLRWFYTGDVGELYPDGTLKIIDRKKDLVKLQHGEYISLGKVESELKTCPLVDNICVVGNGIHDYLVALVAPNVEQLGMLAKSLEKEPCPLEELCRDPAINAAVSKEITEQGRKSKLTRLEIPAKIKLCADDWNPESGLVTAAFKIRRKVIEQFYQNFIEEMYSSNVNGAYKSSFISLHIA